MAYEAIALSALAIARITYGRLPAFAKLAMIAGATSIITYATNDFVLKSFFGRLPPGEVYGLQSHQIFHFFQGSDISCFPSGHMALVASFLGVFYRLLPKLRLPIKIALLLGCVALVGGGWHFISDVLAGTFIGFSVGLIAGELWIRHLTEGGQTHSQITETSASDQNGSFPTSG